MKKLLLFVFILLSIIQYSRASHMLGGEISWECLSDGRYIFKAKIYRNCLGIPFAFSNTNLVVIGNPLPRDANNLSISNIVLFPDSNSLFNLGEIGPQCDSNGVNQINCTPSSIYRSVQMYQLASDTIQLNGIPPSSGWSFSISLPLPRGNFRNLTSGGGQIIRSTMYYHSGSNCNDNSPFFSQNPDFVFYRNTPYSINEGVLDLDGDSLVYEFDNTYNIPPNVPQVVTYTPSFLLSNNGNGMGQDYSINRENGSISLIDSTVSMLSVYAVRKITAYRNGRLVSENYRETQFDFIPKPLNHRNDNPKISPPFSKGGNLLSFKDTVLAGDLVNINLNVIDTNRINGIPQQLSIQIISDAIAKDYNFNGPCTNPTDINCAFISSSNSVFNPQRDAYEIRRSGLYTGRIRWQTDCSDLDSLGGQRTHFFVIRAQDDLCPIPGVVYETVEVTVLPRSRNPCPVITELKEKKSLMEQIHLFPNPTQGWINVDYKLNDELGLKVFNIEGRLVQEELLQNASNTVHIDGESGLYFITLTDQKGEQVNFKVIKK